MSWKLPAIDLSSAQAGTTGVIDWSQAQPSAAPTDPQGSRNPQLVLYNESGCGLNITFPEMGSSTFIPAGGWRQFTLYGGITHATYEVEYALANAGVSKLVGVYYNAGEAGTAPGILGNSPLNVANTIQTAGGTNVKDDTDPPGKSIIEATPTDQTASSWAMNNDASGFLQILSAGVLRKIFNFVRGNATTTKATVTLGDSGDPSILVLYGTATQAYATGLQSGAIPAGVTLAATQLTAGALPAGVTLAPTQLSSGQVASGVTVPAGQVTGGTLPAGVLLTEITSDSSSITSDGGGTLTLKKLQWNGGSGLNSSLNYDSVNYLTTYWTPQTGTHAIAHVFVSWTGSGQNNVWGVGSNAAGVTQAYVSDAGSVYFGGIGSGAFIGYAVSGGYHITQLWANTAAGSANFIELAPYNGSAALATLGVGSAASGFTSTYFDDNGNLFGRRTYVAYGGSLAGFTRISGSGSATVNHGLSTAPDTVLMNNAAGSSSTTFGSGAYTSTTVYIYQYTAMAWIARCIVS